MGLIPFTIFLLSELNIKVGKASCQLLFMGIYQHWFKAEPISNLIQAYNNIYFNLSYLYSFSELSVVISPMIHWDKRNEVVVEIFA
jgi:hypothetical protein